MILYTILKIIDMDKPTLYWQHTTRPNLCGRLGLHHAN